MAPTRPPVSGGRWKAIGLAVAVHVLLAAFLIVGIRWKTSPPPPMQAELFTPPVNPVSKPVPPEPLPPPAPKPPPVVKPAPKPELAKPDIVTEKVRLAAAEAERERFANARKETEKQLREKKLAEEEARRKAEELKAQKLKEAREADAARKKAAEEAKKEAAAKARKEAEEKARKEAEEKAAMAAEAQREAYVKGLMNQASGAASAGGATSGSGTAGAGGGGDSSYRSLLSSRIRAGTIFSIPADLSGNPKAVFVVTVMPDCTIAAIRMRKSSGLPSWDQAAERGIQRASPLPRMPNGTCPPELEITRGPRDSD